MMQVFTLPGLPGLLFKTRPVTFPRVPSDGSRLGFVPPGFFAEDRIPLPADFDVSCGRSVQTIESCPARVTVREG